MKTKTWKIILSAALVFFIIATAITLAPHNKFGFYTDKNLYFKGKTYHHVATFSSVKNLGQPLGIALDEKDKKTPLAYLNGTGMFYNKLTLYRSSQNPKVIYSYYNAIMEDIYDEWKTN